MGLFFVYDVIYMRFLAMCELFKLFINDENIKTNHNVNTSIVLALEKFYLVLNNSI